MNSKILSYVFAVCASTAFQSAEANQRVEQSNAEASNPIELTEESRKESLKKETAGESKKG